MVLQSHWTVCWEGSSCHALAGLQALGGSPSAPAALPLHSAPAPAPQDAVTGGDPVVKWHWGRDSPLFYHASLNET